MCIGTHDYRIKNNNYYIVQVSRTLYTSGRRRRHPIQPRSLFYTGIDFFFLKKTHLYFCILCYADNYYYRVCIVYIIYTYIYMYSGSESLTGAFIREEKKNYDILIYDVRLYVVLRVIVISRLYSKPAD